MVEYVAINDTVYNFKFYRKGSSIEAGSELEDNSNFARVDGAKPAAPNVSDGKTSQADEVAIRTRAKELKISNWHTKGVDKLLGEIAEAEAKLAAPTLQNEQNSGAQGDDNQPAPNGDEADNKKSDK